MSEHKSTHTVKKMAQKWNKVVDARPCHGMIPDTGNLGWFVDPGACSAFGLPI